MERIKQAIERARAERGTTNITPGQSSAPTADISKTSLIRREDKTELPASEVVYQSTRTIPVDFERLRSNRIITDVKDEPAADAYQVLRTQVLQRMRANGWKTLGITGVREGNGKTLTTINLGISLARELNQTVLMVDLDLRRPTMGRYLVEQEMLGISDYLLGRAEVAEILFNPGFDRLVVLPGHEPLTNSSEALSSPKMVKLVEELKSRYRDRIILFDLPPLLVGDDVIAFAPNVDAIMVVVEDGQTTSNDLRRALELLAPNTIIGTVLNKARVSEASQVRGYY